MLITKEVEVGLKPQTVKWYEDKGYKIPRIFKKGKMVVERLAKIIVNVNDLPDNSHVLVDVKCDNCGKEIFGMELRSYKKYMQNDGKYFCHECVRKLYGDENRRISRLRNGKSFYQWCIENNRQDILDRWDYKLNKYKPNEIGYGSNKKIYFKCPKGVHESELKSIKNLIKKQEKSINCDQCNTIAATHPHLIKYFANKEDALKYSVGSHKKIYMKCPDCGLERKLEVCILAYVGFGCLKCSDGKPYPEKFLFNVLQQLLDQKFQSQLSKTTFKWCDKYKYDNYINNINCIIETHGIQHYEEINNNWQSLEKTQDNDFDKEWIARKSNIKNYIILDCRKSTMEWIKNSIMNSRLPNLLNFKEEDINWLKCHEYAYNSLVKLVCDLWDDGIKSTTKIAEIFQITSNTVGKYLKQGFKLGWCNYDQEIKSKYNSLKMVRHNCKGVICLTTGEIFNSLKEAGTKYNILSTSSISGCCIKRCEHSGKHPITGEKLKWMYYDEYLKLQSIILK